MESGDCSGIYGPQPPEHAWPETGLGALASQGGSQMVLLAWQPVALGVLEATCLTLVQ